MRAGSGRVTDPLLTAGALALTLATSFAGDGAQHFSWWAAALVVLAWLPLTVRSRWPRAVLTVVAAADTLHIGLLGHSHPLAAIVPAGTMLALYTVGTVHRPRQIWSAAATVAVAEFAVATLTNAQTAANVLYLNWPVIGAALGRLIGERRERIAEAEARTREAEANLEAEARRQVTDERLRIARDLHDVLAHHITVVNAQASVAQYLLRSDPSAADQALAGIAANSRAALDELRVTLGLLRTDGDTDSGRAPAPTVERLDELFAGFVDAGMSLQVSVVGDVRALSGPTGLALYRIVQEALTNAAKHAPGGAARVTITWQEHEVRAEIGNDAAGPVGAGTGTGHGLIGMRERATSAGGTLVTGPSPAGGYCVTLTLPVTP